MKFYENPSFGNRVLLRGRIDTQTKGADRLTDLTELIVAFLNFANAPKNGTVSKY